MQIKQHNSYLNKIELPLSLPHILLPLLFLGEGCAPHWLLEKDYMILLNMCVLGIAVFACYFCSQKANFYVTHRQ